MATRLIQARGALPKFSLDLPMAGLAAVSVAFVAFAMPDPVFSAAVSASGLPVLLPAAEPPLGLTARLAVIVVLAAATFLFVWFLLRALGSSPPASAEAALVDPRAPRLRRADAHPDAPARRPLFARDLGEPAEPVTTGRRARAFLPDSPSVAAPPAEMPEDWPHSGEDAAEFADFEEVDPWAAAPEVDDNASERPGADAQEIPAVDPVPPVDSAVLGAPSAPSAAVVHTASIASLMERLERGLQRREQAALPPAPLTETAPPPAVGGAGDEAVDARLRTALDHLQKMASRNS